MTYGALVRQIVEDTGSVDQTNKRLDSIGFNIGSRAIDEFYAITQVADASTTLEGAMERLATQALPLFLGVKGTFYSFPSSAEHGPRCVLALPDNPLERWVQLPPTLTALDYSAVLCGAIRGALEAIGLKVSCSVMEDALKGAEATRLEVELLTIVKETFDEED